MICYEDPMAEMRWAQPHSQGSLVMRPSGSKWRPRPHGMPCSSATGLPGRVSQFPAYCGSPLNEFPFVQARANLCNWDPQGWTFNLRILAFGNTNIIAMHYLCLSIPLSSIWRRLHHGSESRIHSCLFDIGE